MDRDPIRGDPTGGGTRCDPAWSDSATCDPAHEYGTERAVVTVARPAGVVPVAAATPCPVRVVLVVAGDTPTPSGHGVEVLRLSEDVGRPAAVNRAVAALDPAVGWVLVADPTVHWDAGVLDGLLAVAARYPRAGLVGPRLRAATGAVLPSAGALPSITQMLRGRVPTGAGAGPTGWLSTTCVLLRRAAWDSVDGFDPRYLDTSGPVDIADVDLADRLGRAGWLVVHEPGVEVAVDAGDGVGAHHRHDAVASHTDGLRRYVRDRGGASARVLLALLHPAPRR